MIVWMMLLGISTGMRTMTSIAVLCWFAWLGLLPQTGWAFWAGSVVSVIVFTICALGEYVGDTLPSTPSRKAAGPLVARLVFGGLVGALAARGIAEPAAGGALFSILGVLIGVYGGYRLRMAGAKAVGRDLPVALAESLLALALALLVAWRYEGIRMGAIIHASQIKM